MFVFLQGLTAETQIDEADDANCSMDDLSMMASPAPLQRTAADGESVADAAHNLPTDDDAPLAGHESIPNDPGGMEAAELTYDAGAVSSCSPPDDGELEAAEISERNRGRRYGTKTPPIPPCVFSHEVDLLQTRYLLLT